MLHTYPQPPTEELAEETGEYNAIVLAERERKARKKKAATRLEKKAFSREDAPARLAGRRRKREIMKNALMGEGKPATSLDVKTEIAMRNKELVMEQQQRSSATEKRGVKSRSLCCSHFINRGLGAGLVSRL